MRNGMVLSLMLAAILASCGSSTDTSTPFDPSVALQVTPFINRVSPTSAPAGATITIFGFGFSSAAPSNILTVGGTGVSASTYALVTDPTSNEIEQLTFVLPTSVTAGAGTIFVTVLDFTSNATVSFTVNP